MKKTILVLLLLMCLGFSTILLACNPNEDELPNILSIEAKLDKTISYAVGDVFDEEDVIVTAILDDDTKRVVETVTALEFDTNALLLDTEGKFTKDGVFTIKIYFSSFETELEIKVLS